MNRLRTFFSITIIILLLLIAGWLLSRTENRIEGVALLISVLSLATALITLNQFLDSKLPEIIAEVTDGKRYNLLTFVVRNVGKMTAFNVKVEFHEKPLIEYLGENKNKRHDRFYYKALAPKNELVIAIGGPGYLKGQAYGA